MTRPRAKLKPSADAAPPDAHPLLLALDLGDWAGEPIARGGRRDALLGRVEDLRLSLDGASLEARVRGNRPLPYRVDVHVEGERVTARCTCSGPESGPCRHAVSAIEVLRFPRGGPVAARGAGRPGRGRGRIVQPADAVPGFVLVGGPSGVRPRAARVDAAREDELALRRSRVRRERATVRVKDGAAAPTYTITAVRTGEIATVTLRGHDEERASCTCDDFTANELRTCKHVERVWRWRGRQRKADRLSVPPDLASVWVCPRIWVDRPPEPLAELRIDLPDSGDPALQRWFDRAGWLRPLSAPDDGSVWVQDALEAFGQVAERRGWRADVDPAVHRLIEQTAAEAERARGRVIDEQAWVDLLDRVGFRLHDYQVIGSRFLAERGRAFLADDMGLGKTIQAIVAALILRQSAGAAKALIVCPASLKHQWRVEIERACGERAEIINGARPGRVKAYRGWSGGFLIVNYELVLRDLEEIRAASCDVIVLDEAQRIKNWNTKTARAVKQLESAHAFVLTGTPLENRLGELHSLVEFLHPRALGPRWRLLPFHAVTESSGRVVAYEALDVLRSKLRPWFIRRERSQVQDQLPERVENTYWMPMSPEQREPYGRHASTVAAILGSPGPLAAGQLRALLRSLTQMRILCNAWAQYEWERIEPVLADPPSPDAFDVRALHSPKLEEFARVLEDLLEGSDRKVVVFSQWQRMLRLAHFSVGELLRQRDQRAEIFHGGLNSAERVRMLEGFRTDPEFRVLFSTDAGGVGLNLQEAASVVVHLEVPWNPAVLEQRVGRVHRIGQRRTVQVLNFVTRDAIEERVRQVVESKRALFDGLLVDGADRVELERSVRDRFVERVRELLESPV